MQKSVFIRPLAIVLLVAWIGAPQVLVKDLFDKKPATTQAAPQAAPAAGPGQLAAPQALAVTDTSFRDTPVLTGLTQPTMARFAADGRIFVAEKSGLIKVYASLTDTNPQIFADLRSKVYDYWDRGLLSIALHPNFPTTPYVYVSYTLDAPKGGAAPVYNDACADPNGQGCVAAARISRLTANGNTMSAETVMVEDYCIQYPSHSIGDLEFAPDGTLYASGGDGASFTFTDYGQNGNPCQDPSQEGGALRAQDIETPQDAMGLNGTIIRLDPLTGKAPASNPLAGDRTDDDPILAYGLRNPFRFTFRPGTSEVWLGDVGWGEWEEIDRLDNPLQGPVKNFGWPCYEGKVQQDAYKALNFGICQGVYTKAGATSPYYVYNHDTLSSSITGVSFYNGTVYPASYRGSLFFADYSRGFIKVMQKGTDGLPDPNNVSDFITGVNAIDLQQGPNGDIFYVDFLKGELHRIEYFANNRPPMAVIGSDKTYGPLPLTVRFNSTGSTDPDNDKITYAWDLDGNGVFDNSTSPAPTFTYTTKKDVTVSLRVTDSKGATDIKKLVISAGNTPPTVTINAPANEAKYTIGDTINFTGTATDTESGALPASSLTWQVTLFHCAVGNPLNCHAHPVQDYAGVASGSFIAPDHEFPSYVEIAATANDGSLKTTKKAIIRPRTVQVTFDSNHQGVKTGLYSSSAVTPFTRELAINASVGIFAPSPQILNTVEYAFTQWSDFGAQNHTVKIGSANQTFNATYQPIEATWRSYDVVTKAGSPQATVADTNNQNVVPLELYQSANDGGVDKTTLFTTYNDGPNPDGNNRVEKYWANESGVSYTYVGKSTVGRGSDTGETNTPAPAGVKDLQMHPPNTTKQTVTAFKIPSDGTYTVSDIAARRVDANPGQSANYRVYGPDKKLITTVKATSTAWTSDINSYTVTNAKAGDSIYFAVDADGGYWWDMTEVAWTIKKIPVAQSVTVPITTSTPGLTIIVDGQAQTTPYNLTSPIGQTHTVYAPSPQTTTDNKTVQFTSWSDSGTQGHTITAQPNMTLNATYTQSTVNPAIFSNGFEEGNTSAYPQANIDIAQGSTLQVTTNHPRSGSYSLEVASDGSGAVSQAVIDAIPPKQNTIYVQSHISLANLTLTGNQLLNIMSIKNENYRRMMYISIGADYKLRPIFFKPSDEGYCEPDICGLGTSPGSFGPVLPRDNSWHEIQIRYTVDKVHGQMELWLDGQRIANLTELDTGTAGIDDINVVSWGTFYSSHNIVERHFFDDMTISNTFIPAKPATPGSVHTWQSYNVNTQAGSPQATVTSDNNGPTANLELYTSTNAGGVDQGPLFTTFNAAENPDLNNRVNKYWANESGVSYTYIGKSTVDRGSDTGETNAPSPTGVRDLQFHPPNNTNLVVAAFVAPEAGHYTISNLGARRVDANAGQSVRYKVFDPAKVLLANLQATSQAWVQSSSTYDLGNLSQGQKIYFAADADGGYWWDMTEATWTITRQ